MTYEGIYQEQVIVTTLTGLGTVLKWQIYNFLPESAWSAVL